MDGRHVFIGGLLLLAYIAGMAWLALRLVAERKANATLAGRLKRMTQRAWNYRRGTS